MGVQLPIEGKTVTTLGIDNQCALCDLKVGTLVDWILLTPVTDVRSETRHRLWQGEIVDMWNNRRGYGDWFVVKWLESRRGGPYRGPRAHDSHPQCEPYAPKFFRSGASNWRPATRTIHRIYIHRETT